VVRQSGGHPENLGTGKTFHQLKEKVMKYTRALAFALLAGATIVTTGCAVVRGQESVGAYVDDASITTAVKAKFVEDKTVDAGAIKVETLNGTVALSGFAKSNAEKAQAEFIARNTKGVREVRNNLAVRP
jgi:osmotically-inducible protein OsmY